MKIFGHRCQFLYIFFQSDDKMFLHSTLAILPSMTCHSPTESLAVYNGNNSAGMKLRYSINETRKDPAVSLVH